MLYEVITASDFEDWLSAERFAWRTRIVDALVAHAEERLDEGHPREATGIVLRALSLDATAEIAARAAIRSLALAGDP